MKELVVLRKRVKEKKPLFNRQESGQRKENKGGWRRPKGLHSKIAVRKAGHAARVEPGFGGPAAARGLHPSGYWPVLISNVSQLSLVDKNQGVIISSGVGLLKKIEIVKAAEQKGAMILNLKQPTQWLERVKETLEKRREVRKKTAGLAHKLEEKKTAEQQKNEKTSEEAKKDYDKLLTKRT